MKKLFILLTICFVFLAVGCNSINTKTEAKFTGAVEQLTQNEMLVSGNGQRILFRITPNTSISGDLRVGAVVTVMYNGILTNSVPAIGTAEKIIAQ
ncbi:MAG: YobA family protein [Oscillospiraceae bacterium]|nr:YobA family protein [Oscillospiraceae bacterium]